jgi:hypothetical protein
MSAIVRDAFTHEFTHVADLVVEAQQFQIQIFLAVLPVKSIVY